MTHAEGVWRFAPVAASAVRPVALVFFPGSLVSPVAYAPIAHAAAAAGYAAYVVELPRRGAFGGGRDPALFARLQAVIDALGGPGRWVAAGHSLGGVVASQVAANGTRGLAGGVLLGTSHPRDVDLGASTIPMTKVAGTRDGLASREEVEGNRAKLPPSTRWVWVDGGNHSQFGWYGFQPGDRLATVDAAVQRRMTIDAVLAMLRLVDETP